MGDELQTFKRQRIAFEEKTPAPNNIKTFESFDQHYGRKYGIICDNIEVIAGTLVPDKYWCEEGREKLLQFIQFSVTDWFATKCSMMNIAKSEAEIEPLIFNILKPIVALTSFTLKLKSSVIVNDADQEALLRASAELVNDSKRLSLASGKEDPHTTDVEEIIDLHPESLEAEDLVRIYLSLQRRLTQLEAGSKPAKIEFAVVDSVNNELGFIEAKLHNSADGIWQCACYLVLSRIQAQKSGRDISKPVWGVSTNYESWYFLKLNGNRLQISSKYMLFLETDVFSVKIFEIYSFLFEMMGIPKKVAFGARIGEFTQASKAFADKLVSEIIPQK